MRYDFETIIDRGNCGSNKWTKMQRLIPECPKGVIPLSTADMEFKNAPEIINGLKDYLDNVVLGYTLLQDDYYNAVCDWMEKRHGFRPQREWFVSTPGVVLALYELVATFTNPGEAVMTMAPVYPHFFDEKIFDRKVYYNHLIEKGNTYEIDFDDFEAIAKKPEVTAFLLCSPHNPVGRVWTGEELERMCRICLENGVYIIDDEVHHDLIMPGYEHVSIGELAPEYVLNATICTAPSKTFNLAGLKTSNIFIADKEKHDKFAAYMNRKDPNILGHMACMYAYKYAGEWLDECLGVIDENIKYVTGFIAENLPGVKAFETQGTYLMWLDFRAWGLSDDELSNFMMHEAFIYGNNGFTFGPGGSGFIRINMACPKQVAVDTCDRLLAAAKKRGFC